MGSVSVGCRHLQPASGSPHLAWTSAGRDRCRWSHCCRCRPAGTALRGPEQGVTGVVGHTAVDVDLLVQLSVDLSMA